MEEGLLSVVRNSEISKGVDSCMLEQMMNAPTLEYMSRGLHAASLRHEVISNNIANINTPNFKRSEVEFESALQKELGIDDDAAKLKMVRTHDRHLPMPPFGKAKPAVVQDDATTMRVDGNNVDVDIEMAGMAKNQLTYNAMATELRGWVSRMRSSITSGQS